MTTTNEPTETLDLPSWPPGRPASCPFDPPPQFAEWREEGGLRKASWNGNPVWAVSRYEDVKFALTDDRISADTMGKLQPGFPSADGGILPVFPRMDNPEHNRIRRLITKDFTVKRVTAMRPQIEEMVNSFLGEMLAKGAPADLVSDFALPVPSLVVSLLLGVPYEDHEFFQDQSSVLINSDATEQDRGNALVTMSGYLYELIERQASEQREGLLSRVYHDHVVSGELTREELAASCVLLLAAGHETTANMISLSAVYLMTNPDKLAQINASDDPAVWSKATDELLRYLTVVTSLVERIAAEDVEIGGQLVRAGEGLMMNLPAANRDCTHIKNADEFDIDRNNSASLAFGHGTHVCIGAGLARAEIEIAVPALFRRLPNLQLAVPLEELNFRNDMGVFGLHSLPVTW